MYQASIARFIFTTIFRSITFVASALTVCYLKQVMEKRFYEKEYKKMVSSQSRERTR